MNSNNNKNRYAHQNTIIQFVCPRTYIFDPNERANVRNVVVGMFGSACVFIYRQIRPVRSPVGCENYDRNEREISRSISVGGSEYDHSYRVKIRQFSGLKGSLLCLVVTCLVAVCTV